MKTNTIYKAASLLMTLLFLISIPKYSIAQWDTGGVQQFSHGTNNQPRILGFGGALIEFVESQQTTGTNGLKFSKQGQVSPITEAYLHYQTSSNLLAFSKTGNTSDSKFDVDADDGDTRMTGSLEIHRDGFNTVNGEVGLKFDDDEALWYDGSQYSWGFDGEWNRFARPITIGGITTPPSGTALLTTNSNNIKMVGNNSYLQWYTSTNSNPAGTAAAFIGSNQTGSALIESNLNKVVLDGETLLEFRVADQVKMVMTPDGHLGIGTTTPNYELQVVGDVDISGQITGVSDARLKKNIATLSGAIEKVNALNPVMYEFRSDEYLDMLFPENDRMGFLAQEMEQVFPELVSTGGEVRHTDGTSFKTKSVNYIEMIPVLTRAIQEQQDIIDAQKSEIDAVKAELTEIKTMLNAKK